MLVPVSPVSPFHGPESPPGEWLFAMCDVGQGDGLALAAGPATAVVVDTGPDPAAMDGCLSGLGVRHIPLLVLTHFHADHIDGVPGVLAGRTVDEIETTTVADPPAGAAKVKDWAAAGRIRLTRAVAGERRAYGPLSWQVLWPPPGLSAAPPIPGDGTGKRRKARPRSGSHGGEEGSVPNNASIVLRVRVGTRDGPVTLLLTGDIEPPAQQALLQAPLDLAADILKIPHHGSRNQDPGLVAAVRPRAALISVGAGNSYGHPAAATVALAGSTGARVFRTDRDGTILVLGPASRLRLVLRR